MLYLFYARLVVLSPAFHVCISKCIDSDAPKLLLVLFDGFRWDYLKKVETPNFDKIIATGVEATYGFKNVFPTKSVPNHFTIVTGLYAESHGVVGNSMFDPLFNETFTVAQETESKWYDNGAEPIWVTNELHHPHRKSGVLFWPGNAASIKNTYPTKYFMYNHHVPFKTRIDVVLDWFTGRFPINLGLVFFHEPDDTGHVTGPDSTNITRLIAELDDLVGYLLYKLEKMDLLDDINLIITSDHGMMYTPLDKAINLDDYIDPNSYKAFSTTPDLVLLPNDEDKTDEIYKNLSSLENVKIYKKKDIPKEYHYTHNRRILPLLLEADAPYSFIYQNYTRKSLGNHGYNNSLLDMHPFFIAMGPAFKKGASIKKFNILDLYPMMCHILKVKPAPNNGSLHNVISLLKDGEEQIGMSTLITCVSLLVFCGLIGGICVIGDMQVRHV